MTRDEKTIRNKVGVLKLAVCHAGGRKWRPLFEI